MNLYEDNLKNLIEENYTEPSALSGVEERFEKRFGKERRKKRIKISSAVTSLLLVFMFITANTDTAWAESLRKIPVLKELFSFMTFSSNYEDQIEELGLVSDNGEHELYLQYALSDEKEIILYLQFPEYITLEGYDRLKVEVKKVYDLKTGDDYTSSFMPENSAFAESFEHNYLNIIGMLPHGLDMHFPTEMGFVLSASIERRDFTSSQGMEVKSTEDLGEFSFETSLQKMSKTKKSEINETLILAGNNLNIKSLERSPLTADLIVSEDPENAHRITVFEGLLKDTETGAVITNDLSFVSYDTDFHIRSIALGSRSMRNEAHTAELIITGVHLLDKSEEYITIDFDKKTMSPEMEGMESIIGSVGGKSVLTFQIDNVGSNGFTTPFYFNYETEDGEVKPLPYASYSTVGDRSTISYEFEEEIQGTITLQQNGWNDNHYLPLKEPARVLIDIPEAFEPAP